MAYIMLYNINNIHRPIYNICRPLHILATIPRSTPIPTLIPILVPIISHSHKFPTIISHYFPTHLATMDTVMEWVRAMCSPRNAAPRNMPAQGCTVDGC